MPLANCIPIQEQLPQRGAVARWCIDGSKQRAKTAGQTLGCVSRIMHLNNQLATDFQGTKCDAYFTEIARRLPRPVRRSVRSRDGHCGRRRECT